MITLTDRGQDLQVVQQVLNGDKAAYEKIIKRYNTQLYRVGLAFLGNEDGVEDAMQNAYLKAYYNLAQFKGNAAFSTWLIRIMINECKLAIRKKTNEKKAYQEWQQDKTTFYNQGIQEILMRKEINEALQQAILELPFKYRAVFILREVQSLSTYETAEFLDITPENVKVRLLRSKAMIRDQLSKSETAKELFDFHLSRCNSMTNKVMAVINVL
jgi:RNA polymerase sigma factor (sigma-70 family)